MIFIRDTKNADSRTADENLTLDSLKEATEIHINEVGECMNFIAKKINEAGEKHDWTKLDNFEEEYGPLVLSGISNDEFMASDWHNRHIFTERHHIGHDAKIDVNLIDVIEHICDVVAAGKGRSGHISSMYCDIDPKLLYRAYWNTIGLLDEETICVDNLSISVDISDDYSEKEFTLPTVLIDKKVILATLEDMENQLKETENEEFYDPKIAAGYLGAIKQMREELG